MTPLSTDARTTMTTDRPRILLFTGDGKGKTTAALGLALRAAGHGLRVCVIQFIKNDSTVGEIAAAAHVPGVDVVQAGRGFLVARGDDCFADHESAAQACLARARKIVASGRYAVVILDEVCVAVSCGLVEERHVLECVRSAPADVCIVLTGRDATPGLIEAADTATEMRCLKHAFYAGLPAQVGVER